MKLVVDSSILYSFFNKQSAARTLASKLDRLFSPEFALREIQEHKEDIKSSFELEEWQFEFILRFWIKRFVSFIPLSKYARHFETALPLSVDAFDIDFFALSLYRNKLPIWSNDRHFLMQSEIKVFSTKELMNEFKLC